MSRPVSAKVPSHVVASANAWREKAATYYEQAEAYGEDRPDLARLCGLACEAAFGYVNAIEGEWS